MIRDISPPVSPALDVFPGDTPFSSRRVMALGSGGSCNVTTVTTTVHVGAHVDAPLHFVDGAEDAASVDLVPYVGRARVIHVRTDGGVARSDLEARDLTGVERVLLRCRAAEGTPRFVEATAFLTVDAAAWLAERGTLLVGLDSFSVDPQDSTTLDAHRALLAGGVRILEGLDLTGVEEGDYELVALPLKLVGVDASPVRAVLRDL